MGCVEGEIHGDHTTELNGSFYDVSPLSSHYWTYGVIHMYVCIWSLHLNSNVAIIKCHCEWKDFSMETIPILSIKCTIYHLGLSMQASTYLQGASTHLITRTVISKFPWLCSDYHHRCICTWHEDIVEVQPQEVGPHGLKKIAYSLILSCLHRGTNI